MKNSDYNFFSNKLTSVIISSCGFSTICKDNFIYIHTARAHTHTQPQRGTVDAAMTVKEIIEENMKQKNCTSVVSLDVQGAFDTAWWPSTLRNLKELKCPKNLFNLSRSYFSNRMASLCGNTLKIKKPVTMGFPQGSCSGPGFLNIQLAD